MTTAELEFPPIATEPAEKIDQAITTAPATLKATVLAQFAAIKPEITALGAKYANVAYDVKTTNGMNDAKAARLELREKGRFMLQRTEKRIKDEANDLKRIVTDEVLALVKIIEPVENAIDEQIKVEEKRKADEKAENDRKEAERKQKLQDGIAGIRAMLERAAGQPAEKIQAAITAMEAWTFPTERWQEFAHEAADATCKVIEKLRAMHGQAVEAERLQAENERLKAELAAHAQAPAAGNVSSEPTTTLPDGSLANSSTGEIIEEPNAQRHESGAQPGDAGNMAHNTEQAAPLGGQAEGEGATASSPGTSAAALGTDAKEASPIAGIEPATLKLVDINARLNPLKIDATGLAALGVEHAERKGVAYLYRESDWPRIKAAIVEWIGRLD